MISVRSARCATSRWSSSDVRGRGADELARALDGGRYLPTCTARMRSVRWSTLSSTRWTASASSLSDACRRGRRRRSCSCISSGLAGTSFQSTLPTISCTVVDHAAEEPVGRRDGAVCFSSSSDFGENSKYSGFDPSAVAVCTCSMPSRTIASASPALAISTDSIATASRSANR